MVDLEPMLGVLAQEIATGKRTLGEIILDRPLPVPWPSPEHSSPPDGVLERLDQVLVVPMPTGGRLVFVPMMQRPLRTHSLDESNHLKG